MQEVLHPIVILPSSSWTSSSWIYHFFHSPNLSPNLVEDLPSCENPCPTYHLTTILPKHAVQTSQKNPCQTCHLTTLPMQAAQTTVQTSLQIQNPYQTCLSLRAPTPNYHLPLLQEHAIQIRCSNLHFQNPFQTFQSCPRKVLPNRRDPMSQ